MGTMSKGLKTRPIKGDLTPDDNSLMIVHGYESHTVAYAKQRKCKVCNKVQDDFHKAVKEAGGLGKLVEKMRREIETAS